MKEKSLRTQIAIASIILMLLLAWGMSSVVGVVIAHRIKSDTGRELIYDAQLFTHRITARLQHQSSSLAALRYQIPFPAEASHSEKESIRRQLGQWESLFRFSRWVGIVDTNGKVLLDSDDQRDNATIDISAILEHAEDGLYLSGVLQPGTSSFLDSLPLADEPSLLMVLPYLRDEEPIGFLVEVLSLEIITDLLGEFHSQHLVNSSAKFYITDQQFVPILTTHTDRSLPPQPLLPSDQQQPFLDPGGYFVELTGEHGVLAGGVPISFGLAGHFPKWQALLVIPSVEVYRESERFRKTLLVFGCIGSVLFAFLAWLMAGIITRPLRKMAKDAKALALGHIRELPMLKRGGAELIELTRALRYLIVQLQNRDIALQQLDSMAHRDALTGLLNRTGLLRFVENDEEFSRPDRHTAVMYLDLDRFKMINDGLGHAAGDELLGIVGERLQRILRPQDVAARIGGDEFILLIQVHGESVHQEAISAADRIIRSINQPIKLAERTLNISCSIGLALHPIQGKHFEQVTELADHALYQAKKQGRNQACFYANDQ